MLAAKIDDQPRIQRVRAILLTPDNKLLFIKRVKPGKAPYWVAPGGGVEDQDDSLRAALERELCEELGATFEVIRVGFVLQHDIAGKALEETFFVCRLIHYDLDQRSGPEFEDPTRGDFIPDFIPLSTDAIHTINIKTPQLGDWLLNNLESLSAI